MSTQIDCICGDKHSCSTKFFYNDISKMTSIMPRGVHVIYVGTNEKTVQELSRLYRTSKLNLNENTLCHYLGGQSKIELSLSLNKKDFEDVKMAVGEGEGAVLAMHLACNHNLKLTLVGATGLSRCGYMANNCIMPVEKEADGIFLRFADNNEIALSFCECLNVLTSLIDWDIAALLNGVKMCPYIFKEAKRAVLRLIKTAKEHGRESHRLKNVLMQTQLRLYVLSCYQKANVLNCSGAQQSAAAMELLFNHEKRPVKEIGINAFLLSPFVLRLYALFLESRVAFSPPPDNNFRTKRIIQFLGLSPLAAYSLMGEPISFSQTQISDYRLSLYAAPLISRLHSTLRLVDDCYALWLRLFNDDGFWIKDYVHNSDLGVCLSLGPDILPAPTLLNYMRHKGLLDKLI